MYLYVNSLIPPWNPHWIKWVSGVYIVYYAIYIQSYEGDEKYIILLCLFYFIFFWGGGRLHFDPNFMKLTHQFMSYITAQIKGTTSPRFSYYLFVCMCVCVCVCVRARVCVCVCVWSVQHLEACTLYVCNKGNFNHHDLAGSPPEKSFLVMNAGGRYISIIACC